MKTNNRLPLGLWAVLLVLLASSPLTAAVITWPAPPETAATNGEYRVIVNGRPVDVIQVPKPMSDRLYGFVKPENQQPYYFTTFDADETVEIAIESDKDLSKTRLLPTRLGLRPLTRNSHRVIFRARPPFKLVVEPRIRHRALVIAANLPERDTPDARATNVVYFAAGRHHVDKPIRLSAGQTLYLAPGAWVEGVVIATGDDITIRGRGILAQSCWNWCKGPASHMIHVSGNNCRLLDFTDLGACQWCIVLDHCKNAVVQNVNLLGGHVLNDDGIDLVSCSNTVIRNVFIRSQDDCITPKYSGYDLLVENAILWSDVANIFRIGYECEGNGKAFRSFKFHKIDVVHQSIHKPAAGEMWSEQAIYIQASNDMMFENMLFEDFRFDNPEPGDNFCNLRTQRTQDEWQHHDKPGDIRNIIFRKIAFPGGLPANSESITLENIDDTRTFDNIRFEKFDAFGPVWRRGKMTRIRGLKP